MQIGVCFSFILFCLPLALGFPTGEKQLETSMESNEATEEFVPELLELVKKTGRTLIGVSAGGDGGKTLLYS